MRAPKWTPDRARNHPKIGPMKAPRGCEMGHSGLPNGPGGGQGGPRWHVSNKKGSPSKISTRFGRFLTGFDAFWRAKLGPCWPNFRVLWGVFADLVFDMVSGAVSDAIWGPAWAPNRHPKRPRKAAQTDSEAKRRNLLKLAPLQIKMPTFAPPLAPETAPKGFHNLFQNATETTTPSRSPP